MVGTAGFCAGAYKGAESAARCMSVMPNQIYVMRATQLSLRGNVALPQLGAFSTTQTNTRASLLRSLLFKYEQTIFKHLQCCFYVFFCEMFDLFGQDT